MGENFRYKAAPRGCPNAPKKLASNGPWGGRKRMTWIKLYRAALRGETDTVKALIAAGTDIEARDYHQQTPLHAACKNGCNDTVKALVAAGADPKATDVLQQMPLHISCEYGHTDNVQDLIAAGADLHATNYARQTPLHIACIRGYTDTAQALIEAGADLHATVCHQTPLHLACFYGRTDTAQALIAAGADLNATNADQQTPFETGMLRGQSEIVSLLESLAAPSVLSFPPPQGGCAHPQTGQLFIGPAGADQNTCDDHLCQVGFSMASVRFTVAV